MFRIGTDLSVIFYLPSVRLLLESLLDGRPWTTVLGIIPSLLPVPAALLVLNFIGYPAVRRALFGHLRPRCSMFRLFSLLERSSFMTVTMLAPAGSTVQILLMGSLGCVAALAASIMLPYRAPQHMILELTSRWAVVAFWIVAYAGHVGVAEGVAAALRYVLVAIQVIVLSAIIFACSAPKLWAQWQQQRRQAELARQARHHGCDDIEKLACGHGIDPCELAWGWSRSQRSALLRNAHLVELLDAHPELGEALVAAAEMVRPGSILVDAIEQGCTDPALMRILLYCRAAPDAVNFKGWTALLTAVQKGSLELCQLLVSNGASTNFRALGDRSAPLHWVAKDGRLEICCLLLEHRAKVNVWDTRKFRSPLGYACARGHASVAELLQGHGARTSPCSLCILKKALARPMTTTGALTTSTPSSTTAALHHPQLLTETLP
mmetsp:Transcript_38875/g.108149  ORF Transcript_38875/g.108149 Transcript_38875/m.108149 type:complete len:436 (-) Transcript_38875:201-1508(-)